MTSNDHLAVLLTRLDQLEAAKRQRRERAVDPIVPIGSEPELMSVQEVAVALKLQPQVVGLLCTEGGLLHVRVGSSVLIFSQQLRSWLNEKSEAFADGMGEAV